MRRVLGLLVLGGILLAPPAWSQSVTTANVVAACGTPNSTYTAGATQNKPITQDTTGKLCDTGSGGGGTSAVNLTQIDGNPASVGHGTADTGTLRVELPTDGTGKVGLNAGSAIVGKVGIDQTTPGTTNGVGLEQIGSTTVVAGNGTTGAGSQRVTIASDNSAVSGLGVAATAGAVPTNAVYQGANTGGNLTGLIACNSSVTYDASTNGATQLVALSSGKVVYVCGYTIFSAGTVNVSLVYGTGSNCGTGQNQITPAYQLVAQTGINDSTPFYSGLNAIASNELCIKTSGGVAVQAVVKYTQF